MGVRIATGDLADEVANPPTLESTMQDETPRPAQASIRIDLGAIFLSLEPSGSSRPPRAHPADKAWRAPSL
jgi:hypothetical protein